MRRHVLTIMALLGCLAFAWPAYAVDLEWGGYWRTRAYTMDGFSGDGENKSLDSSLVDSRGRLWTRHIINENLTWTNRVEFNVIWGDEENGGGIATDGTEYLRFKHSFIDLNTPIKEKDLYWRIGLQRHVQAKGFLFRDDFAGLNLSFDAGPSEIKFIWMKAYEGSALYGDEDYESYTDDLDDFDVDFFGLAPSFSLMDEMLAVTAYGYYLTSENASEFSGTTGNSDLDVFYFGADMEYSTEAFNLWSVLMYETGTAGVVYDDDIEYDVSSYLVALGAEYKMEKLGFHGEFFLSSGDDDISDTDVNCFYVPRGQQHYWAEIMGAGVFDSYTSNGAPGYEVSTNTAGIIAYNLGLSYSVSDNLNLEGDVWYAQYAETNDNFLEDKLGTEVNLRADWMINEDTTLTAVGAYLFADDASTVDAEDPTDVLEVGIRLSFFFNNL